MIHHSIFNYIVNTVRQVVVMLVMLRQFILIKKLFIVRFYYMVHINYITMLKLMHAGAPNFGKTWGDNFFNQGRPKIRNLGGLIHIERPKFQNLGVRFCAKLYQNEGSNIDEMYHKSMYDKSMYDNHV